MLKKYDLLRHDRKTDHFQKLRKFKRTEVMTHVPYSIVINEMELPFSRAKSLKMMFRNSNLL